MSIERKQTIICPVCGAECEFIMWQSLNADLDPAAKVELLDGSLFNVECAKCGNTTRVNYTMLYHDMSNGLMMYFVPNGSIEEVKRVFTDMGQKELVDTSTYKFRIVTSYNSLREKAIIFDNGLDDRVIEIIKRLYLSMARNKYRDRIITDVFFFENEGTYYLQFLGDGNLHATFEHELYENVQKDFKDALTACDAEMLIDCDWASAIVDATLCE